MSLLLSSLPNTNLICSLRQYPNFSKSSPPPVLAEHLPPEEFKKSQAYGRDKAKFAILSTLYGQILETAIIYYGGYSWAWKIAGILLGKLGYGSEYEVCYLSFDVIE